MARKAREPEPQPQLRPGKSSLQLYIPTELADALDRHVANARPATKKTSVVVMLLEDYLRKTGDLK